jgi:hypothetical protein
MGLRKHKKKLNGGVVLAGMLILGAALFFSRSPILVVTDPFFDALYGRWKTREKQVLLSLRFFRPVKPVSMGENAEQDMVPFGVEAVSLKPYCVLFPFRYGEGARRYAGQHPDVPAAVVGGRLSPFREEEDIPFFGTDTVMDMYRSGLCAAAFVRSGGEVFVFPDPFVSGQDREAFLEGLRAGGYTQDPLYMNAYTDLNSRTGVSVVMTGTPPSFLEGGVKIPVILFSWMDPAVSSGDVKIVFDDSPWALAAEAVKSLTRGGEGRVIPSKISVLGRKIQEKALVKEIKNLIRREPVLQQRDS